MKILIWLKNAGDAGVGAYLNKPLDAQEFEKAVLIARARFNDVKELKEKNRLLEEADKLNKTLMKEIHHRVKNNFQLISSLLNLQIGGLEDNQARRILESGRDRVQILAVLHEKLYEIGDFVSLPINIFIADIIEALLVVYNAVDRGIDLEINIDNIAYGGQWNWCFRYGKAEIRRYSRYAAYTSSFRITVGREY